MKKQFLYSLLLLIFLWSCEKDHLGDCFKSTGKMSAELRTIPAFSHIELQDRIQLNYRYNPSYSIRIEGGENLLKGVKTDVRNGTLEIKDNNRCDWSRSFKHELTVTVFAPEFHSLTYRGSGEINFIDTLKTSTFKVDFWNASGNLNLKVKANRLELKSHTAPGVINAQGDCEEIYIYLGGNGQIDASQIKAQIGTAINKNTGKIIVNCQNHLKAEILGSGDIEYWGSPTLELNHQGSGKLIQRR